MVFGCDNAPEMIKLLEAAIEDEHKAQGEYGALADKVRETLAGAHPSNEVAKDAVQTIIADEAKHERFLKQLLEIVEHECSE